MVLKKKYDNENEIEIMRTAVIKRNQYNIWQFRMWLASEEKMFRQSLRTKFKETAIENAEALVFEIRNKLREGKTITSMSCKDGVKLYLKYRSGDVALGNIVKGRLTTMTTHLNHWLSYIGENTKLKDLDRSDCAEYFESRMKKSKTKMITLQNEQSTINAMMKYLRDENETIIESFRFRKVPKHVRDIDTNEIRRQTFTPEEYRRLIQAMRDYTRKTNMIDADEMTERLIIRYYILICANSGLRTGEQRQLQWSDVELFEKNKKKYARVSVRAETSKVRTARTFHMRSGELFERLREKVKQKANNGFVFSVCGEKQTPNKTVYKHFKRLMELANIDDWIARGIVPYSLRHFCITQRIISGVSYDEVADMCGTSNTQIRKTYWHINEDVMFSTASKDYKLIDGMIQRLN